MEPAKKEVYTSEVRPSEMFSSEMSVPEVHARELHNRTNNTKDLQTIRNILEEVIGEEFSEPESTAKTDRDPKQETDSKQEIDPNQELGSKKASRAKEDLEYILKNRTRHPERIRSSELIRNLFPDFMKYNSPDPALIAVQATFAGQPVIILAQEKPSSQTSNEDRTKMKFGMMIPDGYEYVIKILEEAEAGERPYYSKKEKGYGKKPVIISIIDTPGADPSPYSASKLQSWRISDSIMKYLELKLPTISLILGEGGSGGALAMQVADRRLMLSDAMYYVITPESCGSILYRDNTKIKDSLIKDSLIKDSLSLLKPHANEMMRLGVVDLIVNAPAAVTDHKGYCSAIEKALKNEVLHIRGRKIEQLVTERKRTYLKLGVRKKQGLFSKLASCFRRTPKIIPPATKPIEQASSDPMQYAYIQSIYPEIKGDDKWFICGIPQSSHVKSCGTHYEFDAFVENAKSCPNCGIGDKLGPDDWIKLLCDEDSFEEIGKDVSALDLLDTDYLTQDYKKKLDSWSKKSGSEDALVTGTGNLKGYKVAFAISDFNFGGGSMGVVYGHKFFNLLRIAYKEKLPVVYVCSSGGARMHEGTLSLMQMAKTLSAISLYKELNLPYFSILADPSTGGCLASLATRGYILAEPGALISFAGPRVIESARIQVDLEMCKPSYLLEKGGVHEIVKRTEMKKTIIKYLDFYYGKLKY